MKHKINHSFVLRYRIRHIIEIVAIVALVLVVFKQQQAIRETEKETQHLTEALTLESTVPIQYGNYQLFRLKDGRIIAVIIDIPRSVTEGDSTNECFYYRWAMTGNFESNEVAIDDLMNSFRSLDSSPGVMATGRSELSLNGSDRLIIGPLSITWSIRSATSGWLSLNDANGPAYFMYSEQPENLKNIQLSPWKWRPIYWASGPDLREGWDHYLAPLDLITEWEESKPNEPGTND